MTSAAVRAANRVNAARSTGPRTRAGKAVVARNALRHGLSLPVVADLALAPEVAALARRIAGEGASEPRRAAALRIAEAQVDIERIRRLRTQIFTEGFAAADPTARLMGLDRYERRALSRRKFAIRAFDALELPAAPPPRRNLWRAVAAAARLRGFWQNKPDFGRPRDPWVAVAAAAKLGGFWQNKPDLMKAPCPSACTPSQIVPSRVRIRGNAPSPRPSPREEQLSNSHILPSHFEADSLNPAVIRGGSHDRDRVWAGAVRRPPPGKRGAELHQALVARPGCCIRRLGATRAREIQFTRFLRNPAVTAAEMAAHAGERTALQAAGRDVVVIQDTSELALGGRRAKANGYGPVGKGGALRGLLLHAVLAVDAGTGGLIGLVDAQVRNRTGGKARSRRSRKTAEKESQRWINGTTRAAEVLTAANSITGVSDRESDIYEHFATRPANMHLIVRACQNRKIESDNGEPPGLLFCHADNLPEQGRFKANIPAASGRKARVAELAVRFSPVVLCKPRHGASHDLPASIHLTMVDVRETGEREDGSEPIHWRLLTTLEVTSLGAARRVVELYRLRWTIEEFFHTLKTAGFDIEAADIADPEVMIRFVAAATVAAMTVMQLVKARDGTTGDTLADAFDPADAPILEAISAQLAGKTARQQNPHPKGSLAFAAWVIARLGGWTGYYGKPGPKVMRRGLEDFRRTKFGTTLRLQNV